MSGFDVFWLLAVVTIICVGLGVAGFWVDYYLEKVRNKYVLPPPQKRSVAGESHKVWM